VVQCEVTIVYIIGMIIY